MTYAITELLGDGIGPELSACVHRVFDAFPIKVEYRPVDLSLENRNQSGRELYSQAFHAFEETRVAIKYPTVTEKESPNAILRKMCNFSVIHRPVFSIPGVKTHYGAPIDVDIIRVATGGTYEDPGRMIGKEAAVSIRVVERRPCAEATRFAFELAKAKGKTVTSASKYTIQSVTDGLFQMVVDEVAAEYPGIQHRRELFDALLAKLVINPKNYSVIIVLNEYGDFLSDMACGLVGSLGIGGSGNYSFTDKGEVHFAMFDPAGGTAPDIAGKNVVNPTAILVAQSMLLNQLGEHRLGGVLRETTLELLSEGHTTPDLGGTLKTTEFMDKLIETCLAKLG